mgnify:CR=1 FL=1
MIQHFHNARLINPEAGTDAIGTLTIVDGVIVALDEAAPEGAVLADVVVINDDFERAVAEIQGIIGAARAERR